MKKSIKGKVNKLKKSIEFKEEVVEEKVQNMQGKVRGLEEKVEEIYDYQIDPDKVEKSLLIQNIALGGAISEQIGLQKNMMRASTIESKK